MALDGFHSLVILFSFLALLLLLTLVQSTIFRHLINFIGLLRLNPVISLHFSRSSLLPLYLTVLIDYF